MERIICYTKNCEHNLKNVCFAGVITVGEKAVCLSKSKREGGMLAQVFADAEASEELADAGSYECLVQCNCHCVFNKNNICSSNAIEIDDTFINTKCMTRIKPQ
ncbi:MAG: hypothetical protein GX891_00425 [Clostridiales bacterium]|nr:hypothetical protein [Clostridiales bacterium]